MFENKKCALNAIRELNQHATSKLENAGEYIGLLPTRAKDARQFTIIPYLLAVSTLREIRRRKKELLKSEPVKISRSEVFAIIDKLPKCTKNNRYLEKLASRAEKKGITLKS